MQSIIDTPILYFCTRDKIYKLYNPNVHLVPPTTIWRPTRTLAQQPPQLVHDKAEDSEEDEEYHWEEEYLDILDKQSHPKPLISMSSNNKKSFHFYCPVEKRIKLFTPHPDIFPKEDMVWVPPPPPQPAPPKAFGEPPAPTPEKLGNIDELRQGSVELKTNDEKKPFALGWPPSTSTWVPPPPPPDRKKAAMNNKKN
ncbi:unnamed protein product [Caenorhabditis bovis]|uniref:Uncharacterized protein n=1 Tax=Caenorhabditis bovis TaxID=2654633 RepID=A0A8S1EQP9_9PELO|nr:unnamed protein product [Caenorhabditis bovis]